MRRTLWAIHVILSGAISWAAMIWSALGVTLNSGRIVSWRAAQLSTGPWGETPLELASQQLDMFFPWIFYVEGVVIFIGLIYMYYRLDRWTSRSPPPV